MVSDKGATKEVWEAFFTDYFSRRYAEETPEKIQKRVDEQLKNGCWSEGCSSWTSHQQRIDRIYRRGVFKQLGVVSFSEQDWTHIRLWGLYADGHRGVCLVFDKEILKTIPGFEEVRYVSEFPCILEWLRCSHADSASDNNAATNRLFILRKFKQWKEEREWRLWNYTTESSYCSTNDALVGLVFGCEMKQEHKDVVSRLVLDRHKTPLRRIALYQTVRHPQGYRLKINPID